MVIFVESRTINSQVNKASPNQRLTKTHFSDILVMSIQSCVLSFSFLTMGINIVRKQGPRP